MIVEVESAEEMVTVLAQTVVQGTIGKHRLLFLTILGHRGEESQSQRTEEMRRGADPNNKEATGDLHVGPTAEAATGEAAAETKEAVATTGCQRIRTKPKRYWTSS